MNEYHYKVSQLFFNIFGHSEVRKSFIAEHMGRQSRGLSEMSHSKQVP